MLLTLLYTNTPLLLGYSGKLDAFGVASATLTVPVGQPASLAGFRPHHAFVLYDSSNVVDYASNSVPMTFVP